jgi:hypothetical protein
LPLPLSHPLVHLFERHTTGTVVPTDVLLVMPLRLPCWHDVLGADWTSALRIANFLRVVIMTRMKPDALRACFAESLRGSGAAHGTWFVVLWPAVGFDQVLALGVCGTSVWHCA